MRLVFADYLQECGHEDWAQFIRVQIEMEKSKEDRERLLPLEKELWCRLKATSAHFRGTYGNTNITQFGDPLQPLERIDEWRLYSVRGLPSLVVCSGYVHHDIVSICQQFPITHAILLCSGRGVTGEEYAKKRRVVAPRFSIDARENIIAEAVLKELCGKSVDFRFVDFSIPDAFNGWFHAEYVYSTQQ